MSGEVEESRVKELTWISHQVLRQAKEGRGFSPALPDSW
jgi:hypothetical protein